MAQIISASGTRAVGTVPSSTWWLKDPHEFTDKVPLDLEDFDYEDAEEQASFKPLGRTRPVVVRDVIRGIGGNLRPRYVTKQNLANIKELRAKQKTLLLQSPFGESWYISLGPTMGVSYINTDPIMYNVNLTFEEVDVPDNL